MTSSRNNSASEVRQPSFMTDMVAGVIAGAVDILATHPLWTMKTRAQQQRSFTLNPGTLYRGVNTFLINSVPITMLQFGVNNLIHQARIQDDVELAWGREFAAGFLSGVVPSLLVTPTEMTAGYQGMHRVNHQVALNAITATGGVSSLYRGFMSTAIREGVYTSSVFALRPLAKRHIEQHGVNEDMASLAAGTASGVAATLFSHPFDTVKTVQQSMPLVQPLSFLQAGRQQYSRYGYSGFFQGAGARGLSVVAGVTILGDVKDRVERAMS